MTPSNLNKNIRHIQIEGHYAKHMTSFLQNFLGHEKQGTSENCHMAEQAEESDFGQ